MTEKLRYSDEELQEFRAIIEEKLARATAEYDELMAVVRNQAGNDVNDTSPTFKNMEELGGMSKDEAMTMAARQQKFIQGLQGALLRIENKTYGICRITGNLIPKERLRAVPHTTQTLEAKIGHTRQH
ncbi:MAG: TraR/DksA C4-type zinc finger protein [Bacteroidales bacterium]|nr:TraR/DksA C4-type zinc finger protein [Bacteroidales bacterium]